MASRATRAGAAGQSEAAPNGATLRDFEQAVPINMLRAREAAMAHFRPMLRSHGLTEQQWRVLRAIAARPGIEAGPLAEMSALLSPSLTRIVKHLEDQGLVQRAVVTGDQRRVALTLTRRGEQRVAAVGPDSEQVYAGITRRFGAERLAALNALLLEFAEAIEDQ